MNEYGGNQMKKNTGRLILGIIVIILSVLALLQSCTVAGLGVMIDEDAGAAGFGGVILAIAMLAAGIIDIATRNSQGKSAVIVSVLLYVVGAFMGLVFSGEFTDLSIWATFCIAFAIIDIIIMVIRNKKVNY